MAQHYQSKHAVPEGARRAAPENAGHYAHESVRRPSGDTAPHTAPEGSSHGAPDGPTPGGPRKSRVPFIILTLLLVFCIAGAGVYALVHFVIFAPPATSSTEPGPTSPPDPSLSPLPTEPPTQAPTEPDYAGAADALLASMSTRDKICQLFIVTPEALTGIDGVNMAGDTTKKALEDYPVGGVIYNSANLEDIDQTQEMLTKTQEFAKIPLFLSVDEEGGSVARVAEKLGTTSFDPMYSYKDKGETVAHDNAEVIASNLRALGFNLDFAPVADTWSNPENTVIGTRAYSDDFDEAAKLVAAAVKGFTDGGILCTVKHFPGHGGTVEDSHDSTAIVTSTAAELKAIELLPFKRGIDAGADMVMVGHLTVTDIDSELPATLSSKVVPSLLRQYLGYDGVVITDSMQMGAITENYDRDAVVKGVFDADIDIILDPDDLEAYITAIENALENGTITQAQIDAKVKRILTLKYAKGVIPMSSAAPADAPTQAASAPAETAAVTEPTDIPAE